MRVDKKRVKRLDLVGYIQLLLRLSRRSSFFLMDNLRAS